jgi:hypothetical protein
MSVRPKFASKVLIALMAVSIFSGMFLTLVGNTNLSFYFNSLFPKLQMLK